MSPELDPEQMIKWSGDNLLPNPAGSTMLVKSKGDVMSESAAIVDNRSRIEATVARGQVRL